MTGPAFNFMSLFRQGLSVCSAISCRQGDRRCIKKKEFKKANRLKLIAGEFLNVAFIDGGEVVSASGWETSVSSLTPTSAIMHDAYTSIIKKKKKIAEKTSDEDVQKLKKEVSEQIHCDSFCMPKKLPFSEKNQNYFIYFLEIIFSLKKQCF